MVQLQSTVEREWLAHLNLKLALRANKTALVENSHLGPLRVFKPYYPELDGCGHIYLLHPPGGLVIGDQLNINIHATDGTSSLVTTPSAGKVYSAKNSANVQTQRVTLDVDANTYCEWLPQETILFDGAKGQLFTTVNLVDNAKIFMWDIVCLGRPASNQAFDTGECLQTLRVSRNNIPIFIERNQFQGGSTLLSSTAGMQGRNTTGTLLATLDGNQNEHDLKSVLDELLEHLASLGAEYDRWGVTEKEGLHIIRYLGNSANICRLGFEYVWVKLRPFFNNKSAVVPRIWRT